MDDAHGGDGDGGDDNGGDQGCGDGDGDGDGSGGHSHWMRIKHVVCRSKVKAALECILYRRSNSPQALPMQPTKKVITATHPSMPHFHVPAPVCTLIKHSGSLWTHKRQQSHLLRFV